MLLKAVSIQGVVMHACNPYTWEVEAGGPRVLGQLGLHSETLSQKKKKKYIYIYIK
jgi:hypothetical protein